MAHADDPTPKIATYADLLDVPPNTRGEIIDGKIYVSPKPSGPQAALTRALRKSIAATYAKARSAPEAWVILDDLELLLGDDVVVPDIVGWRRERMPEMPDANSLSLVPDWVCETMSPFTMAMDRCEKVPLYQREGVPHVWLVDPIARTLEVLRLDGSSYRLVGSFHESKEARAMPFEAIALDLASVWPRV